MGYVIYKTVNKIKNYIQSTDVVVTYTINYDEAEYYDNLAEVVTTLVQLQFTMGVNINSLHLGQKPPK